MWQAGQCCCQAAATLCIQGLRQCDLTEVLDVGQGPQHCWRDVGVCRVAVAVLWQPQVYAAQVGELRQEVSSCRRELMQRQCQAREAGAETGEGLQNGWRQLQGSTAKEARAGCELRAA